jgi:hypothetical protein
MLIHK